MALVQRPTALAPVQRCVCAALTKLDPSAVFGKVAKPYVVQAAGVQRSVGRSGNRAAIVPACVERSRFSADHTIPTITHY